jgi:hypothetical protein
MNAGAPPALARGTSVLLDMLGHKRPNGSKTERRFIREFIEPLGVKRDRFGNLYKRIGNAAVAWSCHTDTVHKEGGRQLIEIEDGVASLARGEHSNCLGADDTAGAWLMREMILAQRPGLYVFHRAEEIGGHGSRYIADRFPKLLEGISCAIAFDRRGRNDVITHQSGLRCCSEDFALSLAMQLGPDYAPCDGGSFTDTANYVDLVGECTNVSVGYDCEHSKHETLDIGHLLRLRERLLQLDASTLVYSRQPGEVEELEYDYSDGGAYGSRDDDYPRAWDCWKGKDLEPRHIGRDTRSRIEAMCRQYPNLVAQVLEAYGITEDEIREEIFEATGYIPNTY